MTIHKIDVDGKEWTIACMSGDRRNGFYHECHLIHPMTSETVRKERANYVNRTWESFQYETCIKQLIRSYFKGEPKWKLIK